ncbi:MAG: TonB-dependent receptor [Desulfatitalea sp.]
MMQRIGAGVVAGVLLLGVVWCAAVRAEEPAPAKNEDPVMDEVVVTASREKEAVAKVPAHVTVIDAEEIQRSNAQNVPQVLAAAGLHVSDIAGNQRAYTVDVRGFGESAPANLLVLVDGRRINQADLSGTDWALIPLERIERIEVLPGSRGSVLYGDNATGGVVNIITKEGHGLEAHVTAAYGSYDTAKAATGLSGATGIVSYDLTATYLDSDGYRDNSATEAKDAGVTFKLDPSEIVSFNFSGGYHEDDTRLPGSILQSQFDAGADREDTFHPNDYADTEDYYGKAGVELFFLTNDAFRLDLGYRNRDVLQYASFSEGWFTGDTTMETYSAAPRLTFQENFGDLSNRVIFGADFGRSTEDITNTSNFFGTLTSGSFDFEKDNTGYYVQDDLGVTRHLTLSGGYRYDKADFSFSPGEGEADETDFDEEASTFGINYTLGDAKIYASYGKSFRYPLMDELFSFYTNTVNAELLPQTARNWEVGTAYNMTHHLRVDINLFNIRTEDEIFYNPTTFANENLDGITRRDGFEVRLNYRRSGWTAGAGYTYTDAEIDGGQYDNSQIPNVPEHKATANLGYAFDMGLFLGLDGTYTGSRYLISDFNNVSVKQEAYTLVNAKIKYDWRWLTFFADANNIFGKEYASYGGLTYLGEPGYYPSPEFNVLAGVTARFGGK